MQEILRDYLPSLLIGQYPNGPLGGLALTLILSVLGLGLAFPLSIALALCRLSPWAIVRWPSTVIVYVVRGIPLVMLVFWSYFLVPVLIGRPTSAFTTLVVTLVIYQAAYMSEIVRAGIEALPKGQTEASRSLGMTYGLAMRQVVLPQALYNMLPSLISQFVSTIKETSIGYVISVHELTYSANMVNSSLLTKPLQVFVTLSLIYFVVCFALTQSARAVERRVERRRARATPSAGVLNDSLLQSQ
ncbi:amino acid ABC transporter permease [Acidovorax sp. NCPPB 4044]|uniref:amino acid ABC transporter permease n=1 Tax=Acidovorax sp. NCPPB 4044 TaxID=2940490 RepID=UPI002301FFF8|nr:amino acid ABC transporter permease [Acidovorax sp. NCPPB 4044]MDA8520154.1 amino acid ABC transporter permease [Acidovorax sp. NCPPB 4044]